MKTYSEIYADLRHALLPTEHEEATQAAWLLLSKVTGRSTAELLARRQMYASDEIEEQAMKVLARYQSEEPLAYIFGTQFFMGIELKVTPDVLIPREDTVPLAELAIHHAKLLTVQPRILDLCTGSGCVGIAVASFVKDARVTLGDISEKALAIARHNCLTAGVSGRTGCMKIDVKKPAEAFLGSFDLITANPPYVTQAEMNDLPASVKNYEPSLALDGGPDGLDFYRAIVKNFTPLLKKDGLFCFEFGMGQCQAVSEILRDAGFEIKEVKKDSGDRLRALSAGRIGENENG